MAQTCLIIEDNPATAAHVAAVLQSEFDNLSIVGLAGSLSEAKTMLSQHKPELVISDINLQDDVVFSLFQSLETIDFKLIFITAYNKYAVEAFKFSAIDFLEKPFEDEELVLAVRRAIESIDLDHYNQQMQAFFHNFNPQQKQKKLVLKNLEAVHIVPIEDILFVKSDNNYSEFHTTDGRKVVVSKSLKFYDEQLRSYSFFRSHQSYLVNLQFAKTFHKQDSVLELNSGEHIAVAGVKVQALLHKLAQIS